MKGIAYGVGVGPGDPELMTLKACRLIRENDVIAAYSKRNEVDYEKKQVNLFETIMPANGNVNDLVIGKEDTGASE